MRAGPVRSDATLLSKQAASLPAAEGLSLQFLTVLCFLQLVMGRAYILENPQGSDLYTESHVHNLQTDGLP